MYDIRITQNDKNLFKLLNKFTCLNQEVALMYLDLSKHWWRVRTPKLEEYGFIIGHQKDKNSEKIIRLTDKGMNVIFEPKETISKTGKEYLKYSKAPSFNPYEIDHEILVAKICFYILKNNKDLSIDDILTDREQRQKLYEKTNSFKTNGRISDLYIPKKRIRIEVELSTKTKDRMNKIFRLIRNDFTLFIIPENRKIISERVKSEMRFNFILDYISTDDIETYKFDVNDMYDKVLEESERLDSRIKGTKQMSLEIEHIDKETADKIRAELLSPEKKEPKPVEKEKRKNTAKPMTEKERAKILKEIHGE